MIIILVQPPQWARQPSIGIAQLSAFLRKQGRTVKVWDLNAALLSRATEHDRHLWSSEMSVSWSNNETVERLFEENRPFLESEYLGTLPNDDKIVVCFSVTGCSLQSSVILSRWIKSQRPDALIVFGGQLFTSKTSNNHSGMPSLDVDALAAGDGEWTLAELASKFEIGAPLDACAGLWLRHQDGRIFFTGPRPPLRLDDLPFADYSDFDWTLYGDEQASSKTILLMTSRGCIRNCSFCGYRIPWPGFRRMSAERIYAEIIHQRKILPSRRDIKFYDLLLNGDIKELVRLCDLLASDPNGVLPWRECNALVRPEMTTEVCRKIKDAGGTILIVGIESGSQNVLNLMRKQQTVEQAKAMLRSISEAGLRVRANFMFGFPGETEEDFRLTLKFIEDMAPHLHYLYPSYTMTGLEGPLLEHPEDFGLRPNQHSLFWETEDKTNSYLIRLERYLEFRKFATALGLTIADGLGSLSLDSYRAIRLGEYYESKGEPERALEQFQIYLQEHPKDSAVLGRSQILRESVLRF